LTSGVTTLDGELLMRVLKRERDNEANRDDDELPLHERAHETLEHECSRIGSNRQ
jgi:hypothetical protein